MSAIKNISVGRFVTDDTRALLLSSLHPKKHDRKAKPGVSKFGTAEAGEICAMLIRLFVPTTRIEEVNGELLRKEQWALATGNAVVRVHLEQRSMGIYAVLVNSVDPFKSLIVPVSEMNKLVELMAPAPSEYHCDFYVANEDGTTTWESAKVGRPVNKFAIANANQSIALATSTGELMPHLVNKIYNDMGVFLYTIDELINSKVFLFHRLNGWSYNSGIETDTSKIADTITFVSFGAEGFNSISFSLKNEKAMAIFSQSIFRNSASAKKSGTWSMEGIKYKSFTLRRCSNKAWDVFVERFLSLPVMA